MPIEDPNGVISGLDPASPAQSEDLEDLGPHVRNLKPVGPFGAGFAQTITSTEVEINHLGGCVDNVQSQLNEALLNRVKTVPSATGGNLCAFDSTGNIYDTGISVQQLIDILS